MIRGKRNYQFVLAISSLIILVVLTSCNMPGRTTPTPSEFDQIGTQAAQTVMARLTEISQPPTGTAVPAGQATPPAASTPGGGSTTTAPTQPAGGVQFPTAPANGCDQARFIKDVTIPDNTILQPNATFTKTWRLANAGNCTWSTAYALVLTGGVGMGAPSVVPLGSSTAPGGTIDISVNMQAPAQPGSYRSEWMLRNANGQVFGTGETAKPIWVQIQVAGGGGNDTRPTSGLDFVSSADLATWYSGIYPTLPGDSLTFGGPATDPKGTARIEDNVRMESGQLSGKLVLTVPLNQPEGYVYGVFPAYTVQSGDRFKARLGFMLNADGNCGAGKVIFQLAYIEGSQINVLYELPETCNGSMTPVDVSLAALNGKSVQFVLAVKANGSTTDNWAIWNSARITR